MKWARGTEVLVLLLNPPSLLFPQNGGGPSEERSQRGEEGGRGGWGMGLLPSTLGPRPSGPEERPHLELTGPRSRVARARVSAPERTCGWLLAQGRFGRQSWSQTLYSGTSPNWDAASPPRHSASTTSWLSLSLCVPRMHRARLTITRLLFQEHPGRAMKGATRNKALRGTKTEWGQAQVP